MGLSTKTSQMRKENGWIAEVEENFGRHMSDFDFVVEVEQDAEDRQGVKKLRTLLDAEFGTLEVELDEGGGNGNGEGGQNDVNKSDTEGGEEEGAEEEDDEAEGGENDEEEEEAPTPARAMGKKRAPPPGSAASRNG